MPTTTIAKTWKFAAAHHLPNHDGKCRNVHGHTYHVTVEVTGEVHPIDGEAWEGMVCDFNELDDVWQRLEQQLDHKDLNESTPVERTTSELLAAWLFTEFAREVDVATVVAVTVSESPTTWARVQA